MLAALGRAVARHAVLVTLTWAVLALAGYLAAVGGVLTGEDLFSRLSSGEPSVRSESQDGQEILAEVSPRGSAVSLVLDGVDPASPDVAAVLAAAGADLAAIDGVVAVLDPASGGPGFVATDGRAVLVTVQVDPALQEAAEDATVDAVVRRLETVERELPGASGRVTGVPLLVESITSQVEKDLVTGEVVALPLSLVVMVVVFGGLAAAGVPLLAALASIAGGLSSLLAFTHVMAVDASVVNVVTVLGLGLCIDYALLVVSRYREELVALGHARSDVPDRAQRVEAAARTLTTAGRTVLFSTVTVAISVAGLVFFDIDVIRAVGVGASSVVLVALLVSLTLVPALAVLASRWVARPGILYRVPGTRALVSRLGDVPPAEGAFSRLADRVQRRPVLASVSAAVLLVLLALPSLRMDLRSSGVELLPPGHPARVAFTDLQDRFPVGEFAPVSVLVQASAEDAAAYVAEVARLPAVTEVGPPRPVGAGYVVVDVAVEGAAQGDAAQQVVAGLRERRPGHRTWVMGQAAELVDFKAGIRAGAPWALGTVVTATFVLLFLMTGSVLVPLKALVMNVLSLGATFGLLVWVFQDGRFEGLLNFASVGGLESFIPPLVFAFAFGLAMDYEVFLLSRIKEFRDAGMGNDEAVRAGLQRTGRIITAAALIIALVFAGFVLGDLLVIKQTGVALAFAVLVDATIVRILLVPATMTILGEWNWWAPGPLRRLHNRLGIAEAPRPPVGPRLPLARPEPGSRRGGRHARR